MAESSARAEGRPGSLPSTCISRAGARSDELAARADRHRAGWPAISRTSGRRRLTTRSGLSSSAILQPGGPRALFQARARRRSSTAFRRAACRRDSSRRCCST
jgi:hypothetical protein